LFYGAVFAWLVRALLLKKGSLFRRAVYFHVLLLYAVPDAYVLYGFKPLVILAPIIWIAALLDREGHALQAPPDRRSVSTFLSTNRI
jgi:hypothetical protein